MALRLSIPRQPYWLDLDFGVRVRVRPLASPMLAALRSKASRLATSMEDPMEAEKLLGIMDAPDMSAEEIHDGLFHHFATTLLAQCAIIEWDGLLDDNDEPVPVSEETIAKAMQLPLLAERFYARYLLPQAGLVAEGNASGPSSNGISATARATAAAAAPPAATAPMKQTAPAVPRVRRP